MYRQKTFNYHAVLVTGFTFPEDLIPLMRQRKTRIQANNKVKARSHRRSIKWPIPSDLERTLWLNKNKSYQSIWTNDTGKWSTKFVKRAKFSRTLINRFLDALVGVPASPIWEAPMQDSHDFKLGCGINCKVQNLKSYYNYFSIKPLLSFLKIKAIF